MLEAMRSLAIDYLFKQIGEGDMPQDLNKWFQTVRQDQSGDILPFLVEAGEKIDRVYVLMPDAEDVNLVHLEAEDFTFEKQKKIPFVKPSGSQSAAVGPVIKRTFKAKEKEAGPSSKIIKTTKEYFETIAKSDKPWGNYFKDIVSILNRSTLRLPSGKTIHIGTEKDYPSILDAAINEINEKATVYLTVANNTGKWPGECPEYLLYLSEELANIKYVTQATPISKNQKCPLCGSEGISVCPNAVKGAGINISNADRVGAFPGVTALNAWKSFALCIDCADLLYVYKNHVANNFIAYIAGEKALLLPHTGLDTKLRQRFLKHIEENYLPAVQDGVVQREEALIQIIAKEPAVTNLTIIWAKFGQNIEDIHGVITDILPSRLGQISKFNQEAKGWQHRIFPEYPVTKFDLRMSCLLPLFKRPGGKKAKQANASNRLFQLKRTLVTAIYRCDLINEGRFLDEMMTTARWYLTEVIQEGNAWGLLNEGAPKDKKDAYLTTAGWIRHMALLTYYFKRMGVIPMNESFLEPGLDSLKPYFGHESGIDNREKAFAFLLGVLYGKVMQVQAARGVNVGANALTWLRRLTLTGKDLPELYVKVREKLLAYEMEGNEAVRSVIGEVGKLGVALGSNVELNETNTCYFLLLGQSLMQTIIPSKEKK